MNTEELHVPSSRLYGNGLLARAHLSPLSIELRTQETAIRNRWHGVQSGIPADVNTVLTHIQADRGWF